VRGFEGQSSRYVRVADSGSEVRFYFCPDCGSTVHYELEQVPGAVGVPVGVFADPAFLSPRISVYESTQHPWTCVPEEVEHFG